LATLRRQLGSAALGRPFTRVSGHPADQICSAGSGAGFDCPFKATFYRHDLRFSRRLAEIVEEARVQTVISGIDPNVAMHHSETRTPAA